MQRGRMRLVYEDGESALNVRALGLLDDEAYRSYLHSGILWFDHKEILRAGHGGYPLAVSARQVDLLIEELQAFKASMR